MSRSRYVRWRERDKGLAGGGWRVAGGGHTKDFYGTPPGCGICRSML